MKNKGTILIVDDELSMREFLSILLEKNGYRALTAANGKDALHLLGEEQIDLIISDIRMPAMNGLDLLAAAKKIDSNLPVVMITAYASPEDAVNAMKNGAYDYITKPFKLDEIKNVISGAISRAKPVERHNESEVGQCNGIIGCSREMLKIFDLVRRIAPTHANIMIYGESGTGKELVARAIHQHSQVAANAFVPITCSAIPESLIESELFGHVKGAFTGAIANKAGLFEQADHGSVFLDEIGELSPLIQTKLLRVLQEREFKRVGSSETIKVNVRIICATNRNLEDEVIAGRFREDLFYRLAVVPLRLPPLRERKEDIPLLVEHFLGKYSQIFQKEVRELSSYAMQVLLEYDYPGNVRELENIVERGVALENSNIILPESLVLSTHRRRQLEQPSQPADTNPGKTLSEEAFELGLEKVMDRLEKEIIETALAKANHSKMRAAELLQVSFRSLRYKVQKLEIGS
ncbi:MAG: sigma-54-dependent Fis family transcriptional regulator [Desulfobulbaceae bacterium]|nr:sigma-54-dependent Fis family transcriptional regulator [Desulfobulbaceae bacterium]